jgi:membrane protein DedA with SNARE-associated domain
VFRWMMDAGEEEGSHRRNSIWTRVSLLCAAVFIFLIGLVFNDLCDPAPSEFERTVFYIIVLLIFLETVYAGWYRVDE